MTRPLDKLVHAAPNAETVEQFIEALEAEHRLSKEQSRLWRTAVRQVAAVRQPHEPDNAEWLLSHMDALTQRIAGEDAKRLATARTYRSRAAAALKEFIALQKNPVAYSNRIRTEYREPADTQLQGRAFTCRLDGGRTFRYQLPNDGLKRKDVERIAMHLWALAEDFDGKSLFSPQLGLEFGEGVA